MSNPLRKAVTFSLCLLFALFAQVGPVAAQTSTASYAGTYSGTFSGGDSGSFTAVISSSGGIALTGNSSVEGAISGSGQVSLTGSLQMTTGSTSTGSSFTGTINPTSGALSGTWSNIAFGVSGSFAGTRTSTNKASQTVAFAAPQTQSGTGVLTIVGGVGAIYASATSGLEPSLSTTTPGICAVSGNAVTGIAAGNCVIAANQAGDANYNAAAQITLSVTIGPAPTTQPAGGAGVPLNLKPGWNLLGNSSAAPIDVATTFGDATRVTTVWKWIQNASKWAFYAPSLSISALTTYAQGKGYDVLTSIAPKEGFWVNATADATLAGPAASGVTLAQDDLQQGWNLLGSADNKSPSQLNQALSSSLTAAGKAIVTAWAWDAPNAVWKFYAPSLEAQGGTALADYIRVKGYRAFGSDLLSASDGFWVSVGGAPGATAPVPTITGLSSSSGVAGASVTLSGTNFSTSTVGDTVMFGGVQAQVLSATATSLIVTVPTGAATGAITVTTAAGTATSASIFTVTNAPTGPTGPPIVLVNANPNGVAGDGQDGISTYAPIVSADGRFVVFSSDATNLITADHPASGYTFADTYYKDLQTGQISYVVTDETGIRPPPGMNQYVVTSTSVSILPVTPSTNDFYYADRYSMSADGRYIAFETLSNKLIPISWDAISLPLHITSGDNNMSTDIYVKDMATGQVKLASSNAAGLSSSNGCNGYASSNPSVSGDGRYVAFVSCLSDLVQGDTNGRADVFVKDLQTSAIQRVNTNAAGEQLVGGSSETAFSADGRYVFFTSGFHFYRKDLQTRAIILVSADAAGNPALTISGSQASSTMLATSSDGRYVVFANNGVNLASDATNGYLHFFYKDLQTGALQLVEPGGSSAVNTGMAPSLSADGRYMVFTSGAGTYVRDNQTGVRKALTAAPVGASDYSKTYNGRISADGNYVVVVSNYSATAPYGTDPYHPKVFRVINPLK